jgi:hypothetical protein
MQHRTLCLSYLDNRIFYTIFFVVAKSKNEKHMGAAGEAV